MSSRFSNALVMLSTFKECSERSWALAPWLLVQVAAARHGSPIDIFDLKDSDQVFFLAHPKDTASRVAQAVHPTAA
jgi:hypothetical protein